MKEPIIITPTIEATLIPGGPKSTLSEIIKAHQYPGGVPFPDGLRLGDFRFCGEIFDENDAPQPNLWEMRLNKMEP